MSEALTLLTVQTVEPKYLSVQDAAKYLGIAESTAYMLKKEIPFYQKFGIKFLKSDLDKSFSIFRAVHPIGCAALSISGRSIPRRLALCANRITGDRAAIFHLGGA